MKDTTLAKLQGLKESILNNAIALSEFQLRHLPELTDADDAAIQRALDNLSNADMALVRFT